MVREFEEERVADGGGAVAHVQEVVFGGANPEVDGGMNAALEGVDGVGRDNEDLALSPGQGQEKLGVGFGAGQERAQLRSVGGRGLQGL